MSSLKLASFALLLLVCFSATLPATLAVCGYNNCTNYFQECRGPSESSSCICYPFDITKPGACIFRALIRQDLDYCLSHSDCTRRGTGHYCIKGLGSQFGWCLSREERESADASIIKLPTP